MQPFGRFEKKTFRAFSLVELLAVVLIFSIVGGLAWFRMSGVHEQNLFKAQVEKILGALHLAKYKAIVSQNRIKVEFGADSLYFQQDGQRVDLEKYEGVELTHCRNLYFFPDGSASNCTIMIQTAEARKKITTSLHGFIREWP